MEMNRREHGLVGLRIGSAGATERVRFRLDVPDDITAEVPAALDGPDVPTAQLGLPGRLPRGDLPDSSFTLPAPVVTWLDEHDRFAWIDQHTGTGLWLNVRTDHPLLRMVPWERLLADAGVEVPVLRLPGYLGRPSLPRKQPRIALWLTMPAAKTAYSAESVVERVLDAFGELPVPPRVHVFTDEAQVALLRRLLDDAGADAVVHEPPDRASGEYGGAGHPWLRWIERALQRTSVDVLHVVGHGYLSADTPGFATAQGPTSNEDRNWARFVWPNEIAGTMIRIGATGVVITAVPHNYSAGALRLLATQLAGQRAGPAVFEDVAWSDATGLHDAYRLLMAHPTELPTSTRDVAITAHPAHFGIEIARRSTYEPATTALEEVVASGGEEAPAWAASVQSQLKSWEAQLTTSSDSPRIDALRAGLELTKTRLDALLTEDTLSADGEDGFGTGVEA